MKDALGHGSNGHSQAMHDGHPKTAPVAIHPGAAGRTDLPKKMGRRHFEQIAETLRSQAATDPAGHDARVSQMADRIASSNPGFRRDLFVKASQPGTAYKNKSTRAVTRGNAAKQLRKFHGA
jgi:hypothetical protein